MRPSMKQVIFHCIRGNPSEERLTAAAKNLRALVEDDAIVNGQYFPYSYLNGDVPPSSPKKNYFEVLPIGLERLPFYQYSNIENLLCSASEQKIEPFHADTFSLDDYFTIYKDEDNIVTSNILNTPSLILLKINSIKEDRIYSQIAFVLNAMPDPEMDETIVAVDVCDRNFGNHLDSICVTNKAFEDLQSLDLFKETIMIDTRKCDSFKCDENENTDVLRSIIKNYSNATNDI